MKQCIQFFGLAALFVIACGLPNTVFAKPTLGSVSYPSHIEAGTPVAMTVSVNSPISVQSCNLYVDNDDKGAMNVSNGMASISYTFPYAQVYTVFVFCKDANNGMGKSESAAVWVKVGPTPPATPFGGATPEPQSVAVPVPLSSTQEVSETEGVQGLAPGSLVKLSCPAILEQNHPCTAVYYYATNLKRYAFPNSNVFFSWYEDFHSVITVTPEQMASIPFGGNVTYRPGIRMVKFTTDNKVYAVSRGGRLRWISSEQIATALYGEKWNTIIDDIPDTFYTNYQFDEAILSAEVFHPQTEAESTLTISAEVL